MYYKIYIKNLLNQPELVCDKKFVTLEEAEVYKTALETSLNLPKGYFVEIQGFYE